MRAQRCPGKGGKPTRTARLRIILRLALCLLAAACTRTPRTNGPLTHEAYVWQRAWTPQVRAAIERGREPFGGFTVLAAEIAFTSDEPKISRPAIDFDALKSAARPVGLAIRIAPHPGPFREDDARARAIAALATERLAEARRRGIQPCELQIDFDCAAAKLDGYRAWLRAIRRAVAPLPVCPTTLPSWLDRREFAPLVRDCGRFILQVHSVEPPRERATTGKLTDPARAVAWVERAAQLGVPFRVAMPTYTYLVAFDSAGKVRGISAEAPSSQWPADAEIVRWEADPGDLAALVARWTKDRPQPLRGVIWYRLPVAGDALNWRWPTLDAVLAGRAPTSRLRLEATTAQPSDLFVINDGERDEPLPQRIEARWENARATASDASEGYELAAPPAAETLVFQLTGNARLYRLPPGARRHIGWIRCEPSAPIRVSPGESSRAVPAAP